MPTSSPRVLVSLATYNELENLPRLVDEIQRHLPDADILVIDDNSPDGTGHWCDERAASDPRVRCLHRAGKLGLGTATIAAMQAAIEARYDFLLNMDADFSHQPQYLPELVERAADVDVMIGSRYVAGGGTEGWPWYRKLMSRGVNTYARLLLGLPARDCSGAYRCYRVSLLEQLEFAAIRSRGYAFQEEVLWHMKRAGARFGELPIIFIDRQFGSSKINARESATALWIIFRLGVKNWIGL
ncbi:MAG: polyprenol monophosphomannose synthase [Planctomycetales bacterium]|nr:polyprenol monophosphomannose synthase [Planctomycetales bacterium]